MCRARGWYTTRSCHFTSVWCAVTGGILKSRRKTPLLLGEGQTQTRSRSAKGLGGWRGRWEMMGEIRLGKGKTMPMPMRVLWPRAAIVQTAKYSSARQVRVGRKWVANGQQDAAQSEGEEVWSGLRRESHSFDAFFLRRGFAVRRCVAFLPCRWISSHGGQRRCQ